MVDPVDRPAGGTTISPLSRRHFLTRVAAVGTLAVGGSTILAACGGGDTPAPTTEPASNAAATVDAAPAAAGDSELAVVDASTCQGYDTIDEAGMTMRTTLTYTDSSPEAGKHCGNCLLQKAHEADSNCLGCQLFAGPVSPAGWCQSWAAQPV